jgi:hypothetical protein
MKELAEITGAPLGSLERHPRDGWTMAEPYPLGESTRAVLRALIRVMCPPPPAPQLRDLENRIELQVRQNMQYFPPLVAWGFKMLLHVLDWSPIWRRTAWSRISRLDRGRAESVLNAIGASGSPFVRLLIMGVRSSILVAYYDQDEVHAALGYEVVKWMRARIDLRHRLIAGGPPSPVDQIGPHSSTVTP